MDGFAPRCVALALDGPVGLAQGWELVVKLAFVAEVGAPAQLSRVAPTLRTRGDDEWPSDVVGRGEPASGARVNLVGPWPQRARGPLKLRVGEHEWFGTRPSELGPPRGDLLASPQFPLRIRAQHQDLELDVTIQDPELLCALAHSEDLRRQEPLRAMLAAIQIDVDTEEVMLVLRAAIPRPRPDRAIVVALHRTERPIITDGLERSALAVLPQEPLTSPSAPAARATLPDWSDVAGDDGGAPVGSQTLPLGVRSPARTALAPKHVERNALPFEPPLVRTPARTVDAPTRGPSKALPFADPPAQSPLPFRDAPRAPSVPAPSASNPVGLPFGPNAAKPLPPAPPVGGLQRQETLTMARVDESSFQGEDLDEPVTERPPPVGLEGSARDTLPPDAPDADRGLPFEAARDALAAPRAPAISFDALRAQLGTPPGAVVAPSFMREPERVQAQPSLNIPTFDAAERRPVDASAPTPALDRDALRIEGLTLEEFTELRGQVLGEPKSRAEVLKARGLGEVRWRIIERRWATHFQTLEQKPDALVALAADMRRAARARVKPLGARQAT